MKNLCPIEENLINIYKSIAEKCQGQKKENLLGELEVIKERYELYLSNKQRLSNIEQLDYLEREEIKDQLISCYGNNITLNNLKTDITLKQELYYQAKCPYCGINSHGSFDHYLPKEDYPDFSVLAVNLIPCCEKCNSKKGKRWKDDVGNRLFLNYYYDLLSEEKYLYAYLSYDSTNVAPTVSFDVVYNEKIKIELFEIINSHYEKLELCQRFESHANDEISNFFLETQLAAKEGVNLEHQKQSLARKIKILTSRAGKNNWLVAIYEAIYESKEFFNRCYEKEYI